MSVKRFTRVLVSIVATLSLSATGIGLAAPANAQAAAPWDGNPISPGLGPTYGEVVRSGPAGDQHRRTAG